jgi:hypothetical protein
MKLTVELSSLCPLTSPTANVLLPLPPTSPLGLYPPSVPAPLRPCSVAPQQLLANLAPRPPPSSLAASWLLDARWGEIEGEEDWGLKRFVATSSRTGAKTWRLPHEIELDRTTVLSADRGDLAWEHELVPSFREGTTGCRRGGGRFFFAKSTARTRLIGACCTYPKLAL